MLLDNQSRLNVYNILLNTKWLLGYHIPNINKEDLILTEDDFNSFSLDKNNVQLIQPRLHPNVLLEGRFINMYDFEKDSTR